MYGRDGRGIRGTVDRPHHPSYTRATGLATPQSTSPAAPFPAHGWGEWPRGPTPNRRGRGSPTPARLSQGNLMAHAEVLVIGAGIAGASAAALLAREISVILLEAEVC